VTRRPDTPVSPAGRLEPERRDLIGARYVAREVYRVLISCGANSSLTNPKEDARSSVA
jgi:hypothetical protein